ncbi:TrmB family transcriptional regulator [Sphaerisporangium rufum]|nr:TrmB family transcriptional regulator [Sphaerisporangium rufum]
MLEMAGLDAVMERAYRLLITAPETDLTGLAAELGVPIAEAERALRDMRAMGLVRETAGSVPRFSPVAPDLALGPELTRRHAMLDSARRAVDQLAEEYRTNVRRRDAAQLVEILPSRSALREKLRLLQDGAREEVLYFCRAGHVAMPSTDNREEPAALERGVAYRVIYERALLEQPGMLPNVAYSVDLGEQARAMLALPVRMMIVDRRIAVMPLVQHVRGVSEPTAAVIHHSSLLDALIALFESHWTRATPVRLAGDDTEDGSAAVTPSGDDLYLLSLLVAGVSDKSIATQLGLSLRTVQRRLQSLMELAGAQTRMQLAWHAAREGWL